MKFLAKVLYGKIDCIVRHGFPAEPGAMCDILLGILAGFFILRYLTFVTLIFESVLKVCDSMVLHFIIVVI